MNHKDGSLSHKEELRCQYDTFSGRVSTLKRIRPKQSIRTTANDIHSTRLGFLATHVPYCLDKAEKLIQHVLKHKK